MLTEREKLRLEARLARLDLTRSLPQPTCRLGQAKSQGSHGPELASPVPLQSALQEAPAERVLPKKHQVLGIFGSGDCGVQGKYSRRKVKSEIQSDEPFFRLCRRTGAVDFRTIRSVSRI